MTSPGLLQYLFLLNMGMRSVFRRRWVVLLNCIGTIVAVTMLLSFLAVENGFKDTLKVAGEEKIVLVLRQGAQGEITSVLSNEELDIVRNFPGIKYSGQEALLSGESYVMVDVKSSEDNSPHSTPLRGLLPAGVKLRSGFQLLKGRMNIPGKAEIIIGANLAQKFPQLKAGSMVELGKSEWLIVGVFGFMEEQTIFEGEMWTDTTVLQNQFNRGKTIQSVRIGLQDQFNIEDFRNWVTADKRLGLKIKTEKEFYAELSEKTNNLIFYIGWPLSIVMALGALSGALNLMDTMVQSRAKETAVLRSVGFKRPAIVSAIVTESILTTLLAALIGCVIGYFLFNGVKASLQGSDHSQIMFSYKVDFAECLKAVLLALVIGLLGGLGPAMKITRGTVRDAIHVL